MFTTAKLETTGHRWLAELSNYNFTIQYRSGKKKGDADALSRQPEDNVITTVFPDVVKAICQTVLAERDESSFVTRQITTGTGDTTDNPTEDIIPDDVLAATALRSTDCHKAQSSDAHIKFVIDSLLNNNKPTTQQAKSKGVDSRYLADWDDYTFKNDVLFKLTEVDGEVSSRLVLPALLQDIIFKAYHDDLGHQGRDRTTSLLKQRFNWPGLHKFVKQKVRECGRCIRRKTAPVKAAQLVNITSSAPMDLVCIDYLSLERSKGGFENILVITDHFSRYAQAIPTRNQTARTTARALFENFFVHYGFPAKLHSDKAANFESKVIKKLCKVAGVLKTRTTPYHPMGNGMTERFNKTLLNMLGTLNEKQKSDWKAHVSTLTHAYNAAVHESTGFSPFFLMFGRHPRLSIDAVLGLGSSEERKSHFDYVDKLKVHLAEAYKKAIEETKHKGQKYKKYYDQDVRHSHLQIGDRIQGKHKLADLWESDIYVIKDKPMPDVPVYIVQKENSPSKPRTLHRNLLLPVMDLPISGGEDSENTTPKRQQPIVNEQVEYTDSSDSSSENEYSTDEETIRQLSPSKNCIPATRCTKEHFTRAPSPMISSSERHPLPRRGQRRRYRPQWMRSDEWKLDSRPYVTTVQPKDVVDHM